MLKTTDVKLEKEKTIFFREYWKQDIIGPYIFFEQHSTKKCEKDIIMFKKGIFSNVEDVGELSEDDTKVNLVARALDEIVHENNKDVYVIVLEEMIHISVNNDENTIRSKISETILSEFDIC